MNNLNNACGGLDQFLILYRDDSTWSGILEACFGLGDVSEDGVASSSCLHEPQARFLSREEAEIVRIERETQVFIDEVSKLIRDYVSRTRQLPPMTEVERIIGGNLSFEKQRMSELVVDSNLRILLPSYGNLELPLQPLSKALYFLFLRHPEGIRLSEMADYRNELEDLYNLIMPMRDDALFCQSITLLTDPLDTDSLRQHISRIKRIVKAKILSPATAEQYYISGERGREYRIPLSRNLVHLPMILML